MRKGFFLTSRLMALVPLILFCFNLPSSAITNEITVNSAAIYQIRVVNDFNGSISVKETGSENWIEVGLVKNPVRVVNKKGYTASNWAQIGHVAASAVNAIHIKTDYSSKENKSTIFSLLPDEFSDARKEPAAGSAAIYTNIPGGHGIFGGGYSPYVGNQVLIENNNQLTPIEKGYKPKYGDIIVIEVSKPIRYPKEIVFQNKYFGKVTVRYVNGEEEVIGEVLKPVWGVGRFDGGQYADAGRIRANHPGVIDISTSTVGNWGGFQIIPDEHANSPEMSYVTTKTQWMVVGPISLEGQSLRGLPPLFGYFIQPEYRDEQYLTDTWRQNLLNRFLVEVKMKGKTKWRPMPVIEVDFRRTLPKWADTALQNVSEIRILFPIN